MFGFPPVFTLFPIQLQEKLCPCLCFDQVERGMCNRFERNVELFAMRISSPVSLREEQALHLLAVMPQSCFLKPGILPAPQAVALLPVASSQKACGESLCSCVMQKKRKERRQSRLKIISAGLRYRIWEKTTFSCYCIVKANMKVSSLSQQWVLNPSASSLCSVFSSNPGLLSQV